MHRKAVAQAVGMPDEFPVLLLRLERCHGKKNIELVCIRVYHSTMTSDEIINKLKADGWQKVHQKGSHIQFKHPAKPGKVTVPHPRKDLPLPTVNSILKQAGLKL